MWNSGSGRCFDRFNCPLIGIHRHNDRRKPKKKRFLSIGSVNSRMFVSQSFASLSFVCSFFHECRY